MKYKYMAGILGAFLITQSCTKLDPEVFSEAAADKFPTTEEELLSVVGSSYNHMRNFVWAPFEMQEVSSDEIVVPTRGPDWYDNGRWQQMARHEFNPVTPDHINGGWDYSYSGIAGVNLNLATLKNSPLKVNGKETIIAELRTLRAWYYYLLIDFFGNVPLVTEDSPAGNIPPRTRKEIFDFVEKELKEALPDLKGEVSPATYGRMTKGAAHGLLAKLYLNAEVFTGMARWQEVVEHCDAVTALGYNLVPDYFSLFSLNNHSNGSFIENIIVAPFDKQFAEGFGMQMRTLHYALQDKYGLAGSPWNGFATYADFYNSYSDNDVRKNQWLAGPQLDKAGNTIMYSDAVDGVRRELNFTPKFSSLERSLGNQGVRQQKYQIQTNNNSIWQDNDWAILRYADVLLMKAEASFRLGATGDALMAINKVRSRADLDPIVVLTLEDILAERGRELSWEGWRRNDLIRFGKWEGNWGANPQNFAEPFNIVQDPTRRLYPIPANQLSKNPLLKQNPGY